LLLYLHRYFRGGFGFCVEGLNQVSKALFEKATQGNVTAMIYYLKVRDRENCGENQPEPLREIPPMQIVVDSRAIRNNYT